MRTEIQAEDADKEKKSAKRRMKGKRKEIEISITDRRSWRDEFDGH